MNSISTLSTPPLSVPPTQNTAPVIRFQCLFTHDLRRKAKRWQDGYLRFHTFNRRIMVYDTAGNLIGDLHWRESDRIHDGDELELERGVLVQVGQELESTVTDLTPLLEKKRPSSAAGNSPPARAPLPQNRSSGISTPYPSSNRLKSLNEVLGIRKSSSFSRPSTVARSPYEERQQQIQVDEVNDGPVERPSKRRKATPEYENVESSTVKNRRPARPSDVADDIRNTGAGAERNKSAQTSTSTEPSSKRYQKPSASSASSTNPSFQLASNLKAEDLRNPPKGGRKKKDSGIPSNQKSVTDMFSSKPTTTTLRIADERPRKKLMCLEMLSGPEQHPTGMKHLISDPCIIHQPTNADYFNPSGELSRKASKKGIALRPKDKDTDSTSTAQRNAASQSAAISSSQKTKSLLEFFKPKPAIESHLRLHEQVQETDDRVTDALKPIDDNKPKPSPPRNRLPIQRSFSTTDALLDQSLNIPIDSRESQLMPDSRAHPDPPPPKPQFPSLQKSLSDTSALRSIQKPSNRTFQTKLFATTKEGAKSNGLEKEGEVDVDEEANEKGPWTVEALDLFDWWPPDRPKPSTVVVP